MVFKIANRLSIIFGWVGMCIIGTYLALQLLVQEQIVEPGWLLGELPFSLRVTLTVFLFLSLAGTIAEMVFGSIVKDGLLNTVLGIGVIITSIILVCNISVALLRETYNVDLAMHIYLFATNVFCRVLTYIQVKLTKPA